jgi:hypothetical protein
MSSRNEEGTIPERLQAYLKEHKEPEDYDIEQLKEKYLLIDWIACQLCFRRPIKTKQLFLYGQPSTQKRLILNILSKVDRVLLALAGEFASLGSIPGARN